MNRWINRLFAFGTVGLAIIMLVYGIALIQKNTPRPKVVPVRFSPPTHPSAAEVESMSQPQEVDGKTVVKPHPLPASTPGENLTRFVGGVGIIEPAGEAITIGSQSPGIVAKVLVEPGAQVKAGAPLLILDQRTALASVRLARSNLLAQEARLKELLGQVEPQRARVDAAAALRKQFEAARNNARQELQRAEVLRGTNSMSEEELGQRRMNLDIAEARVGEADARYRESIASLELLAGAQHAPTIEVQQAAVEQAQAALAREEVALELLTILAPKDCTVLQVKVRAGEFVPASVLSNPLITLGVTDPFHVRVDIDEADIPRFKPAARAFASVRGRPQVKVPLTFVRSEPYVIPKRTLNGSVSERVDTRVLQLIYSVSPASIQAVPGQQVDVSIEETD